jgi:hypothetical protein
VDLGAHVNIAAPSFDRSRGGLYMPREKRLAAPPPPCGLGSTLLHPFKALGPTPPPVTGASLWLYAPAAGNTSSVWADNSGNSRNAAITNISSTFALTGSGINGQASYLGPDLSNSSYALTPSYALGPAVTIFTVYQLSVDGAGRNRNGLVDAQYSPGYALMTSFGASVEYGPYGYVQGNACGTVSGVQDTNPHIVAMVYPDPSVAHQSSWYLDGTLFTTGSSAAAPTGPTTRQIGNWAPLSVTIQGLIGEVLEYPFALSGAQMTSTFAWMGAKWGITV